LAGRNWCDQQVATDFTDKKKKPRISRIKKRSHGFHGSKIGATDFTDKKGSCGFRGSKIGTTDFADDHGLK
jgi:hypothetical protein